MPVLAALTEPSQLHRQEFQLDSFPQPQLPAHRGCTSNLSTGKCQMQTDTSSNAPPQLGQHLSLLMSFISEEQLLKEAIKAAVAHKKFLQDFRRGCCSPACIHTPQQCHSAAPQTTDDVPVTESTSWCLHFKPPSSMALLSTLSHNKLENTPDDG